MKSFKFFTLVIVISIFTSISYSFEICSEEYLPVCGQDNITYFNECIMKNAGTQLAFDGLCDKDQNLLEEPPMPSEIEINNSENEKFDFTSQNEDLSIIKFENRYSVNVCNNLNETSCNNNINCDSKFKRSWIFFKSFDFCSEREVIDPTILYLDESIECSNIVNSVCAEDLNTYPNACYAQSAGFEVLYYQRCEEIRCENFDENSCVNYDLICTPNYSFSFLFLGEKDFISCSYK